MDHSAKKILALRNEAKDCPICHVRFNNNIAFASGCLHCFCYQCIINWVQRRATCPLCRKPIEYIIKNVKSNDDYDIEEIVPPANDHSDQEDDLSELSAASDQESGGNASTASAESDSDTSQSDAIADIDEPVAQNWSDENTYYDHNYYSSEYDPSGYSSDGWSHHEPEPEPNLDSNETESDHQFNQAMCENDSEISEDQSSDDVLSSISNNSSKSDDNMSEGDTESNDVEVTLSWTAISSSISDQDSLSSIDLEFDDYSSSSSDD